MENNRNIYSRYSSRIMNYNIVGFNQKDPHIGTKVTVLGRDGEVVWERKVLKRKNVLGLRVPLPFYDQRLSLVSSKANRILRSSI